MRAFVGVATLAAGLFVASLADAQAVTRGPYLQNGSDAAVSILWRTDVPTDSRVRFGASPDALDLAFGDEGVDVDHEVRLTGLSSDTRYYYSVGSSDAALAGGDAEHHFTTAPPPGTASPVRIWVLGDSGSANQGVRDVRDAFLDLERREGHRADLWLMLGDNAYPDGTDGEFQAAVFDVFPDLLRTRVLWPTLGNHDARTQDGQKSGPDMGYYYLRIFSLPTQAQAGGVASGTENYYAFDYADVHFVCLDATFRDGFGTDPSPDGAMLRWLATDLALNRQPWVVAFWHHSPYSRGSHPDDLYARDNFVPVAEAGGVDLVLTGHSHSYERSFLLHGAGADDPLPASAIVDDGDGREDGDGPYVKPEGVSAGAGTVYIVAGNGSTLEDGTLDHPAMFASIAALGSIVIDVEQTRMDVRFVQDDGSIGDHFTIVKGERTSDEMDGGMPDGATPAPSDAGDGSDARPTEMPIDGGDAAAGAGPADGGEPVVIVPAAGAGGSRRPGGRSPAVVAARLDRWSDSRSCGCRAVGAPSASSRATPFSLASLVLAFAVRRRRPRGVR